MTDTDTSGYADLLARTFAAHEFLAPDPADLLDGLDDTMAARRRTRTALAGGALVPLAAAGIAAVALARSGGQAPAAGPSVSSTPTSSPRPHVDRGSTAPPLQWTSELPVLRLQPHGLAAGARRTLLDLSPGEQAVGYDMRALGSSDLYVAFTLDDHGSLATDSKRGAQHSITVGGRPARESGVPGSYQLTVARADGSLLTVIVQDNDTDGSSTPVADMSTLARSLAMKLGTAGTAVVQPPLELTTVPGDFTVTGARIDEEVNDSVTDPDATEYTLGTARRPTAVTIDSALGEQCCAFAPTAPGSGELTTARAHGTPGRAVQGHATTVIRSTDAVELVVRDIRPGREVILVGRADSVNLDDLYSLADGLRWVG